MIPISMRQGNDCWTACICSILEVSPELFPRPPFDLVEGNAWDEHVSEVKRILKEIGSLEILTLPSDGGDYVAQGWSIGIYLSPSGREQVKHAVVCYNGAVVFDPSPTYRAMSIAYETLPEHWDIFQALDPGEHLPYALKESAEDFRDKDSEGGDDRDP